MPRSLGRLLRLKEPFNEQLKELLQKPFKGVLEGALKRALKGTLVETLNPKPKPLNPKP